MTAILDRLLIFVALALGGLVVIAPMSLAGQLAIGIGACLVLFVLVRLPGDHARLAAILVSTLVSARYIFWRTTETLAFLSPFELVLGAGLLAAEIYAWVVLVLGYVQTAWPLNRKPVPLPNDPDTWPTVDVYIPTYSEDLSIVRDTVFAAMNLDYPPGRFRVYILDDGRREEFRKFAEDVGVGYITRPDNKGAKAGNLNHALTKTDGELIAIFDCDHVPTRAFLQLTVGWFVRDLRIAMLQTPHYFYSPDPFERNLDVAGTVPNEGKLFYGQVQTGNDTWGASFFCGSCAVLRRSALETIGGFATETVTEDAHTALKLHRHGWDTAYLRVPAAAGLATERFALHVGQRIRWARGMVQIFRLDNPLLGRGLSLAQRLCYLNAMLHFLFALPRVVFLTAPLAYLALDVNIVRASGAMIAAYALPHILAAIIVNSRLQGGDRHSFWNEIYETAIAFHILVPTLVTLFAPKRGKFNVTAKGGTVERTYFDAKTMRPHLVALGVLLVGIGIGLVRWFWGELDGEGDIFALNIGWATVNLLILAATLSVGRERRQLRQSIRVAVDLPIRLLRPNGEILSGRTVDLSKGGGGLRLDGGATLQPGEKVVLELPSERQKVLLPATAVGGGATPRISFAPLTLEEERRLVVAIMGRADAWIRWDDHPRDRPIQSLLRVLRLAFGILPSLRGARAALLACSLVLTGFLIGSLAAAPARAETRSYTFEALGQSRPIALRGWNAEAGLPFSIRRDAVATSIRLHLRLADAPTLPDDARLDILLNGLPVTRIAPDRTQPQRELDVPLPPFYVQDYNTIGFALRRETAAGCEAPDDEKVWSSLLPESALEIETARLPLPDDLSILPMPFFDPREMGRIETTFVFAEPPEPAMLEAAAAVASWLGALASYRGARYSVRYGEIPASDAIVFARPGELPASLGLPAITGPGLALVANPAAPDTKLLIVRGRNATEIKSAALALALNAGVSPGPVSAVVQPDMPQRTPYDAPIWIPSDRPVQLGELANPSDLVARGAVPQPIVIRFRAAPDFHGGYAEGVRLLLRYRWPSSRVSRDGSTVEVSLNGTWIKSIPLAGEKRRRGSGLAALLPGVENEIEVVLPPYLVTGNNELTLHFRYAGVETDCAGTASDLVTEIDPGSTIDFSGLDRLAELPNLAYFVNSGLPMTRLADLSETAAVLPSAPSREEVAAFLDVMGSIGNATGLPAVRLLVTTPETLPREADRDIIAVGTLTRLPIDALADERRLSLRGRRLFVQGPGLGERLAAWFDWRSAPLQWAEAQAALAGAGDSYAALFGFPSPYAGGRSLVLLTATDAAQLERLATAMVVPKELKRIQGDTALLLGDRIESFRIGPTYPVGSLSRYGLLRWYLTDRPLPVAAALLACAFLLAAVFQRRLSRIAARRLAASNRP